MKDIKFRDLRADELELRVGATTEKGFSLLIYKTARVDANILDETVGAFNWQKRFYQVKNTMICEIGININYDDETKPQVFVYKADGGDDDYTMEKVKAECSDSMKRACFQWGIGRKLYNSPFIWITKDENNNPKTSHYSVKEIVYDETSVIKVVVINEKTKEELTFKNYSFSSQPSKNQGQTTTTPKTSYTPDEIANTYEENIALIGRFTGKLDNDKYVKFFDWLEKTCGTREIKNLTVEQAQKVINAWKMK